MVLAAEEIEARNGRINNPDRLGIRRVIFMLVTVTSACLVAFSLPLPGPFGPTNKCTCQCYYPNRHTPCGDPSTVPINAIDCTVYCFNITCASTHFVDPSYTCSNSTDECLSTDTMLYSCTREQYVAASSVRVGDQVRTINFQYENNKHGKEDYDSISDLRRILNQDKSCSEVYYVYHHPMPNKIVPHVVIDVFVHSSSSVDNTSATNTQLRVSPHHLIPIAHDKQSYDNKRTDRSLAADSRVYFRSVMAKHVRVGDRLIVPNKMEPSTTSVVATITKVHLNQGEGLESGNESVQLMSLQTVDSQALLELPNGLVVSTAAFDDIWYPRLFAPLRYLYIITKTIGGVEAGRTLMEGLQPVFRVVDTFYGKLV